MNEPWWRYRLEPIEPLLPDPPPEEEPMPLTAKQMDYLERAADKERIEQLESLLRELIDIEGPQPGHVMWFRKVQAVLGSPASGGAVDG